MDLHDAGLYYKLFLKLPLQINGAIFHVIFKVGYAIKLFNLRPRA